MKVKNDHRSKFSNLSNWKEEARKNQGFNGIRIRDLRDTGAMPYQLSYKATHWERGQFIESLSSYLYCDDHFSLSSVRSKLKPVRNLFARNSWKEKSVLNGSVSQFRRDEIMDNFPCG